MQDETQRLANAVAKLGDCLGHLIGTEDPAPRIADELG